MGNLRGQHQLGGLGLSQYQVGLSLRALCQGWKGEKLVLLDPKWASLTRGMCDCPESLFLSVDCKGSRGDS